ncbi:hypothetical protein D9757_012498 [Collybiopsis confluens]|uniref:TPR-like protein n=1 Tax=Collybiopsis confluens TaxID=2823264 RepID=A0A8H5GH58_9AGAR|nr:hypothetical protein D9757_012498 [Collybiopsis confluens]
MMSKERHYWNQLRSALTAGQWSSSSPAKTPNGYSLPWSELFRKFNKHCKGYADVATVAEQTQVLGLLLGSDSDQNSLLSPEEYPLELGDECILLPERAEEVKAGYEVLKKLESSNFDTLNFALAYYAYALSDPSECLNHLAKVPDTAHVQNHIPLPTTLRASTLAVPGSRAPTVASTNASNSTLGAGDSAASMTSISIPEIRDGRAWAITETIRSLCLQGMSHEKLNPSNPLVALKSYSAAFPLLSIVETELTSLSLPTTATIASGHSEKVDFSSFTRFREAWRWVERLLWRAIVLACRIFDVNHDHRPGTGARAISLPCKEHDSLWTWLDHYSNCSAYWPANFCPSHRSTISVIYLRALVLRYGDTSSSPSSFLPHPASSLPPSYLSSSSSSSSSPPSQWMHTARNLIQEYRAVLNVSTRFPKAGERNYKVEDFADLCVAVWESMVVSRGRGRGSGGSGGSGEEYAGWVLDVLWWSTRLTFNSYTIQRHLTRLLYVSGDAGLARRMLRLYVQVVSKAHQAGVASGLSGGELKLEADGDREWVYMCVFGARMICRGVGNALGVGVGAGSNIGGGGGGASIKETTDDLKEAGELIEKAKTRLDMSDKESSGSVDLAEGIWLTCLAFKQHDPDARPVQLAKAHQLLIRSVETWPTPAAHYHLALSYARYVPPPPPPLPPPSTFTQDNEHPHPQTQTHPGHTLQNTEIAVHYAATAAEGNPSEIRYWHLLVLLSAKMEKWEAAFGALESGVEIGEEDVEGEGGRGVEEGEQEGAMRNGCDVVQGHGPEGSSRSRLTIPSTNGHIIDGLPQSNAKSPLFPAQAQAPPPQTPIYTLGPKADDRSPELLNTLPRSSELLQPFLDHPQPSDREEFEYALQLRMTQVAVVEYVEGAEGAAEKLPEVFQWIAEKRGVGSAGTGSGSGGHSHHSRSSHEISRTRAASAGEHMDMRLRAPSELALSTTSPSNSQHGDDEEEEGRQSLELAAALAAVPPSMGLGPIGLENGTATLARVGQSLSTLDSAELQPPIPIMILPATPDGTGSANGNGGLGFDAVEEKTEYVEKRENPMGSVDFLPDNSLHVQTQAAVSHDRDASKSKKMQQKLKSRVQKGGVRISSISKKIGHGVVRNGSLRKFSSTPDFHAALRPISYQASSIHSRRRLSAANSQASGEATTAEEGGLSSPPPPPPPALPSAVSNSKWNSRTLRENRLLSDLWLMSAATFRRLGKIEQAKGAIQEAEVRDDANPGVWVQLGLYYVALKRPAAAIEAFQKALFISPDDVTASVHLSRMYLFPEETESRSHGGHGHGRFAPLPNSENVDLAAGLLAHLTKGVGWDVAEAWYFLAKAYGMQGRKERERESLEMALRLSENRGVRDFGVALGLCL